MSRFLTSLDVRDEDEFAGTWRLLAPLRYESDVIGRTVTVPADFITDFASVPRLPIIYLAQGGKGQKAAVVHDWLYNSQEVPREQADDVLREALKLCGYSGFTAGLFWSAVRLGGGSHWKAPNLPQEKHVDAAMQANQAIAAASYQAP